MNEKEIYWIYTTSANCVKYPELNGYNMSDGGEGLRGFKFSEQSKEKMRNARIGKKITEETKEKLRKYKGINNKNFGKKLNENTKIKIKENHADVSGNKNPMFGKQHSQKTKDQISRNKKGKLCGDAHPSNKYIFTLSNDKNFWNYFNEGERHYINCRMTKLKNNVLIFNNVTITRKLKERNNN